MATESLFGGVDLETTLNSESIDLLNAFLTDTVGGSVSLSSFDGSTLLVASGDNNQHQGALLPGNNQLSGNLNDGAISLDLQLPASVGMMFEGEDNVTPAAVATYLQETIEAYLPVGENDYLRNALLNAVTDLVDALEGLGATVTVRFIEFLSSTGITVAGSAPRASSVQVGLNDVLFDATGSAGTKLFAFDLNGLNQDQTLVLAGIEAVMLAGSGSVRIAGDAGAMVTSDVANQNIIGGGGNDTLIGGGGSDTLTGGAGDDTFGFVRFGHFTIEDFGQGDKIGFNVPWIHSLNDLVPYLTKVTQTTESLALEFGPNFSLTLVGVSASDLTADMIKFTF